MPKFIKMGLHGTGYLGKKEASQRAMRKWKQRRKVLPGYPILASFESIDQVREYLQGDRITCLLCGKDYKRIGTHLKQIHNTSMDEYKKLYKIPWTYSLICSNSSEKYSAALQKRMQEGWMPPFNYNLSKCEKRKCFWQEEIALQNLKEYAEPKHPLIKNPNGILETFTARRERLATKRGTIEFKQRMRERPQCDPNVIRKRLGTYWKGRKQSEEHKMKRFKKQIKLEIKP